MRLITLVSRKLFIQSEDSLLQMNYISSPTIVSKTLMIFGIIGTLLYICYNLSTIAIIRNTSSNLNVVDMRTNINENIKCIQMKTLLISVQTTLCVHNDSDFLSHIFHSGRVYEEQELTRLLRV